MSRGLKRLARDLQCPVLALSQLNRGVEERADRRLLLAGLGESGSIEVDADVVLMLYRDDYYEPATDRPGETDVLVRKNRHGGLGEIVLTFDSPHVRVSSLGRVATARPGIVG
jgi:replicative DNA helicase